MKAQSHTGRRVFQFASAVFIFIIILTALYLSFYGLPESSIRALEKRIQIDGIVVMIGAVKPNILEGLVIENVRCFRKGDIGRPVAEIERAALKLPLVRPSRAKKDVVKARIRNGTARVIVGRNWKPPGRPAELRMKNIDVQLEIDHREKTVRVSEMTAEILGVRVTGRGVVLWAEEKVAPTAESFESVGGRPGAPGGEFAEQVFRRLEAVAAEYMVTADVEFMVDLNDVHNREVGLNIEARSRKAAAQTSIAATCQASVQVSGRKGTGSLNMKNHVLRGVRVEQASGDFDFDENGFILQRMDVIVAAGLLKGPLFVSMRYSNEDGSFEGAFRTGFDPRALLAPFEEMKSHVAEVIGDFVFHSGPPGCDGCFNGTTGDGWKFLATGSVCSDHFTYRGVSNEFMNAGFSLNLSEKERKLNLSPFTLVTEGEKAEMGLIIDFLSETVGFHGTSTVDPRKLARMIGPLPGSVADTFNFAGPVKVTASGIVDYNDQSNNDFTIHVEGKRFGWNNFLCDEGSLSVNVLGRAVRVSDIRGTAFGGVFQADVFLNTASGDGHTKYEVEARVKEVEMMLLMHVLTDGAEHAFRGTCAATLSLQGYAGKGQGETARGKGKVEIKNGYIFQIPLFGGLSDFLTKYVPGLKLLLRQTAASAEVEIKEGRICSKKIRVDGDVFSLRGNGCCSLDGELSFDTEVVLLRQDTVAGGIARLATLPVSKMFEFHLGGTIEEPRWRPIYVPKEMFFMFGDENS